MSNYDKNLTRALAILAMRTDETEITCCGYAILVSGQNLYLDNDDDRAVLSILMADTEFWEVMARLKIVAYDLHNMRTVWLDAASKLEGEVAV